MSFTVFAGFARLVEMTAATVSVTYIGRTACSFVTNCVSTCTIECTLWNKWNKKGLHFIFSKEGDECSSKSKNTLTLQM